MPTDPNANANPLTLVMTAKSDEAYAELKALIGRLQSAPAEENRLRQALDDIGRVHFARFVFLPHRQLAVITTYDGDFDEYLAAFAERIGFVFDEILGRVEGGPPTPVNENRKEFAEYVREHDLTCVEPFYSAYPGLPALEIRRLRSMAAGGDDE